MKVEVKTESTVLEGNDWVEAGTHWTCYVKGVHHEIKGSPLGRGKTEKEAIEDLIRRVGYESKIKLEVV